MIYDTLKMIKIISHLSFMCIFHMYDNVFLTDNHIIEKIVFQLAHAENIELVALLKLY